MVKRIPNPNGRPRKTAGGLTAVIYVRASPETAAALAEIAAQRSADEGRPVSAADVAREAIECAVQKHKAHSPDPE